MKFAKEHNRMVKSIIDGNPTTLIHNGKIDIATCLKYGISANDLMFKLRSNGIYEVAKVKRAVLEQNGQLTIIEQGDENIRYPIIMDGQINEDLLDIINKDEEWLLSKVHELTSKEVSDIYLGEYISGEIKLYEY